MLECGFQQLHRYSVSGTMLTGEIWTDDMLFEIKGKKVAAHLSRYFLAEHQCLHAGQIALCFLAHAAI